MEKNPYFSDQKLLNSEDAAKFLGLSSRRSLESMRWRGIGPKFVKVGKLVRYSTDDLLAFIEDNKH